MRNITVKDIDSARELLLDAFKEVKNDQNIHRSTFLKGRFEVEQTLFDAVQLLDDLRDYWHITGKIDKFDKN